MEATCKRVEIGEERATVRWEGEVGDTGAWLGVEWDREGRGKHDGVHKGVTYFTPVRPGNNCSFVRRSKVTNWGVGLMEAVVSKYGEVSGATAGVHQKNIDELQAEIGARFVEVVGFDKVNKQQSQIKQLRTVSVRNMGVVARPDTDGDLGAELPSLGDLDLSDSLVTSWAEVAAIINSLQLHTVDLGGNLLEEATAASVPRMESVRHLVLGAMLYTGLPWAQVLAVAAQMPGLAVLQVHNNNIASIPQFPAAVLANVTELDLDGNKLGDWAEVLRLGELQQLQHLRLNGNQLANILPAAAGTFVKLESLQLTDNCVTSWRDVGHLDSLQLSQLRFRNNPVISSCKDEEVARQLAIARISSLKSLNGTNINQSERRWAEIDYLKTYGQKWIELSKLENSEEKEAALKSFLQEFNRYDTIVKMYGEPEPGDGAKVDTSLKASLLRLKIRSPELIGSAETVKKIPSSMNVRALRALLQRLYKSQAGGNRLRISLLSGGAGAEQEVEIDNDMREVSFYSVSDGDTLLVRWSDPALSKPPIVTDL